MLQTVPGIQLDYVRTPGTFTFFNIQGTYNNTVLVFIDGVRQNDFNQNLAEPGIIPVQQIERIEIVKGAASAAWGPALGGVINIVTKSPDLERPVGGMLSGSIAKRATTDTRLELSGVRDRFGYYVTGGTLHSDGLLPNNDTDTDHVLAKFSWRDPAGGTLTAAYSYLNARRGEDEGTLNGWPVHDDDSRRQGSGSLQYSRSLASRLALDLDSYVLSREEITKFNDRIDGENIPFAHTQVRESSRGGGARLSWGDSRQRLVIGAEYAHAESRSRQIAPGDILFYDSTWDRWSTYANGTLCLGSLTVLPGIRYDHTGLSRGYASYTLGATWQLSDKTLLRGYGARGYGLPFPTVSTELMTVSTVQGGVESSDIPFLWVKGTYFFNRLRNSESLGLIGTVTNQNRQGFELEGRTVPWFGVSLTGGYTYTYVKDIDSGERLRTNSDQAVPPHLLKLGLLYDDAGRGLRGALNGNYVNWYAQTDYPAAAGGMTWDLHLSWKVRPLDELSPELFFSGRNLFSNIQTVQSELFKNAPCWFEGGVRYRF